MQTCYLIGALASGQSLPPGPQCSVGTVGTITVEGLNFERSPLREWYFTVLLYSEQIETIQINVYSRKIFLLKKWNYLDLVYLVCCTHNIMRRLATITRKAYYLL